MRPRPRLGIMPQRTERGRMVEWNDLITQQDNTLDWCDECGKWHKRGVLTVCTLVRAKRLLDQAAEPTAPMLPHTKRPWRRVDEPGQEVREETGGEER